MCRSRLENVDDCTHFGVWPANTLCQAKQVIFILNPSNYKQVICWKVNVFSEEHQTEILLFVNLYILPHNQHTCVFLAVVWPSHWPLPSTWLTNLHTAQPELMLIEAGWTGHVLSLPRERGFSRQSIPLTLWPEPAVWKLPCLKASIRRFWTAAAARKAKLRLMQFHAWQWFLQQNLYFINLYPHVEKRQEKRKWAAATERDREKERAEQTKIFYHARSNYWTPFAVLSL